MPPTTESERIKSSAASWGVTAMVCFVLGLIAFFFGLILILGGIDADAIHNAIFIFWAAGVLFISCFWAFLWCQALHIRARLERSNELLEYMVSTKSKPNG